MADHEREHAEGPADFLDLKAAGLQVLAIDAGHGDRDFILEAVVEDGGAVAVAAVVNLLPGGRAGGCTEASDRLILLSVVRRPAGRPPFSIAA
jgi:hypothetical protein